MFGLLLTWLKAFLTGDPSQVGQEGRRSPRLACQCAATVQRGADCFDVYVVDIGNLGLGLQGGSPTRPGEHLLLTSATGDESAAQDAIELEVMWCYTREHDGKVLTGAKFLSSGQQLKSSWLGALLSDIESNLGGGSQKRRHTRMNSLLKAELREFATGRFLNQGDVSNISLGGLLLKSHKAMHSVPLLMVLIGPYTNYPTFFLKARYISSRKDDDGRLFLHSMEFVEKSREQEEMLKTLIRDMMEEER